MNKLICLAIISQWKNRWSSLRSCVVMIRIHITAGDRLLLFVESISFCLAGAVSGFGEIVIQERKEMRRRERPTTHTSSLHDKSN